MLGHDTPKHGLSVAHTTEEAESVRRCESRAIGSQGYDKRGSGQLPVDHLPRDPGIKIKLASGDPDASVFYLSVPGAVRPARFSSTRLRMTSNASF
jgi:hypothetical protein